MRIKIIRERDLDWISGFIIFSLIFLNFLRDFPLIFSIFAGIFILTEMLSLIDIIVEKGDKKKK